MRMWTKNSVVLFAMLALLAGCGDPNRSKIVGTWQMEKANNISSRFNNSDEEAAPNDRSDGGMAVTFYRSGAFLTKTNLGSIASEKKGAWELKSFDEAKNIACIECTIQTETTEHEVEIVDQDTISMVPPNMAGTTSKLRFVRSK